MLDIAEEFSLNEKQLQAFHIIASTLINQQILKIAEPAQDPLRMLMTGPGGTGKTHVVHAVKKVMNHYGIDHGLRTMAFTGTAASLIDGTTIHKGLGIS
ncbi:hypothetical protein BT96DRAFT_845349, partial [Gymnopus androsaceus JB14]